MTENTNTLLHLPHVFSIGSRVSQARLESCYAVDGNLELVIFLLYLPGAGSLRHVTSPTHLLWPAATSFKVLRKLGLGGASW